MSLLKTAHHKAVHNRRVIKLSEHLSRLLPNRAKVVDIGCGDGLVASLIKKLRPDVSIQGIDILLRPETHIPVTKFDGTTIPFTDDYFDAAMFVDVLHHTDDPFALLKEATRVAKNCLILKDHTDEGLLSNETLRFMDWVGNKPHGVRLPYNYWTMTQWQQAIETLNLKTAVWEKDLKIYLKPADWIFGRSLHFVAKLTPR